MAEVSISLTAHQVFSEIRANFNANKSIQWDLYTDGLEFILTHFHEDFAQNFADEYLLKIINAITQQSPSKLGAFEKNLVEKSLLTTVAITVKLLSLRPHLMNVVAHIFNPSIPFYAGSKIGYAFHAGNPMTRTLCGRQFAELHGFSELCAAMQQPALEWPGAANILFILKMMEIQEAAVVSDDTRLALVRAVMAQMLSLSDEALKRETTEVLHNVMRAVSASWSAISLAAKQLDHPQLHMDGAHQFWMSFLAKLITSSSLVLRLFGWDVLNDFILDAKSRRAVARTFVVEGAGTECVNGIYTLTSKPGEQDSCQFTKAPTQAGDPLLTLFRCTMRNKSKWWFISQADLEKPGTDKDIDYYLHRSGAEDEREPALRGWTRVNTGIPLMGAEPAPLLKRGDEILLPKGSDPEGFLDRKLLSWIGQQDLLNLVFGPMVHREIVSRSGAVLAMLAQYDQIGVNQLSLMWRAAVGSHDQDIVEEIFAQLVQVSSYISPALFDFLMSMVSQELQQGDCYAKVAQFVEKFALDGCKLVNGAMLLPMCITQLVSVVWDVYRHVGFENLKFGGSIKELLSACFRQPSGHALVHRRITQCQTVLETSASAQTSDNEGYISRVMDMLLFLVPKHCDGAAAEKLESDKFANCLLAEIRRFVTIHRAARGNTEDYYVQLSSRLMVLRSYYSISAAVTLPLSSVQFLWDIFAQSPRELDRLFLFLKTSSDSGNMHVYSHCPVSICSPEVAVEVFRTFLCSPELDWAHCGSSATECFHAYFSEIDASLQQQQLQFDSAEDELHQSLLRCGLETLWRIVLSIDSAAAAEEATEWLVGAYNTMVARNSSAYGDLLSEVFGHLGAVQSDVTAGKPLSLRSQQHLSRCVHILQTAVLKSKGTPGLAHSVRGVMSRICVTVFYRRVSSSYSQGSQSSQLRTDKGFEGSVVLEAHSCFTVQQLKDKLVAATSIHADPDSITVESNTAGGSWSNSSRLFELGVTDGSELSVSYQASHTHHNRNFDSGENYFHNRALPPLVSDSLSAPTNIGQLLASDYSHFDCLLSLCEQSGEPVVTKVIWDLLMLLPTQADLYQQTLEQICFSDRPPEQSAAEDTGAHGSSGWNELLVSCSSVSRTAYLLQIIDSFLQPAPELLDDDLVDGVDSDKARIFKESFVASGGFSAVLQILLATPTDQTVTNATALAVALHVIHFLLFGGAPRSSSYASLDCIDDDSVDSDVFQSPSPSEKLQLSANAVNSSALLELVEEQVGAVLEKLLHIAKSAAANEESSVVQNALMVITNLISRTPDVAGQLVASTGTRRLLITVLHSASKKVRELAADFAVQVGRSQAVVLHWLLEDLESLSPQDGSFCKEAFYVISSLMAVLPLSSEVSAQLARTISHKLLTYPRDTSVAVSCLVADDAECTQRSAVLLGFLELLAGLLATSPDAVLATDIGQRLVPVFLQDFLFTLPSAERDCTALCDTAPLRSAAFSVLSAYICLSVTGLEDVLHHLTELSSQVAASLRNRWSVQVLQDVKTRDLQLSGLKNQGCTCYMNSLLQQLYMNNTFRDTILATPLRESTRSSLWHRSGEELVGQSLAFEQANNSWRVGNVVSFDPMSGLHSVEYRSLAGQLEESVQFNIHVGRVQRETGRVRLLSASAVAAPTERESDAYRVLEQLQRTFCFMKLSKRRYFDPRPFVDACKTLNLNFNVYHQNDAAEFCDQLLDRIETATRGKHSQVDVWSERMLKEVFGGQWLYQKIPQECEIYSAEKSGCGHFQGSRLESFLKVELMIRGKEKIGESLQELVQGELMDGDNKIQCDVCNEKKSTVRRTCFGKLPNTMVLHLKRFDLDFQTFETVKLNNRLEFSTRINMMQYTKEGIEARERQERLRAEDNGNADDNEEGGLETAVAEDVGESALDSEEYEYVLQGVLVHAGVAQGGHYYSFIREDDPAGAVAEGRWFKFDDEDVSLFAAENIPAQCFGGPMGSAAGMHSMMDEDRTSNALMLFYNKVSRQSGAPTVSSANSNSSHQMEPHQDASADRLVDGMEAFQREVEESNLQHVLSCYLVDADLHNFVRTIVSTVASRNATETNAVQWSLADASDDLPLRSVQFACSFLLDTLMHFRERSAMRASVVTLKQAFELHPHTAMWFVQHVLCGSWFKDYLFTCSDVLARGTFVQLLLMAVQVIAPSDAHCLLPFSEAGSREIRGFNMQNAAVLCALLASTLMESLPYVVNYVRNADEVFLLVRDLAASVPCMCVALQARGCVSFMAYFAMPAEIPSQRVRAEFERAVHGGKLPSNKYEYSNLLQSVFEAKAALLGVPQIRKVNLLQDLSFWESDLVPEARDALTTIFLEASRDNGMDAHDLALYFDRVSGGGPKITAAQVRNILDKSPTTHDGRLSLEGFLHYQADLASYNPKKVWRDLHAYGFRNDLTRLSGPSAPAADESFMTAATEESELCRTSPAGDGELLITEHCRECLSRIALYEAGMGSSEAATRAIAQRVCLNDRNTSELLLVQALHKLHFLLLESAWGSSTISLIVDFLKLILCIPDELGPLRAAVVLFEQKFGLASRALQEKNHPTVCRSNEYNRSAVLDRYISYVQDLVAVPGFLDALNILAETNPSVQFAKGLLRLRPECSLTENEYVAVANSVVLVDGAGTLHVNGEYRFTSLKNSAGCYERRGEFKGSPNVRYTLYKCALKSGAFQWFLSVTPDDLEPGTAQDLDFYYAPGKMADKLPPSVWQRFNSEHSCDPPPRVESIQFDNEAVLLSGDSSDSEQEDDSMIPGEDELLRADALDSSFVSSNGDYYD